MTRSIDPTKTQGLPDGLALANYPTPDGWDDKQKAGWDQNSETLLVGALSALHRQVSHIFEHSIPDSSYIFSTSHVQDASSTFERDIPWLRSHTNLPIILKVCPFAFVQKHTQQRADNHRSVPTPHKTKQPWCTHQGILRPDDALAAAELGCEGIIVSNHGGRQLDSAISSIEVNKWHCGFQRALQVGLIDH